MGNQINYTLTVERLAYIEEITKEDAKKRMISALNKLGHNIKVVYKEVGNQIPRKLIIDFDGRIDSRKYDEVKNSNTTYAIREIWGTTLTSPASRKRLFELPYTEELKAKNSVRINKTLRSLMNPDDVQEVYRVWRESWRHLRVEMKMD